MEEIIKAMYIGIGAMLFAIAVMMLLLQYNEYMNNYNEEKIYRKEPVVYYEW